jgi:hypothetical protein
MTSGKVMTDKGGVDVSEHKNQVSRCGAERFAALSEVIRLGAILLASLCLGNVIKPSR